MKKHRPPVLFLHIGWAREYRGAADDPLLGQFGFFKEGNDDPGEAFNFRVYGGRCYGYAAHHRFNLTRLGVDPDADNIGGILVVWTATNPQGGRYIVGWYHNATVWAEGKNRRPSKQRRYIITEAIAKDCHLIPVNDRSFYIPSRRPGWPGQTRAFFASEHLSKQNFDELFAYINGKPSNGFSDDDSDTETATARGEGRNQNPDLRVKIWEAAVNEVTNYYKKKRWKVNNVEKENCGWDLDIFRSHEHLRVEVKGCSGYSNVELTPNEYEKMNASEYRMSYRLAVVRNALSEAPQLTIFEYIPGREAWVSEGGTKLKIKEKTGAVCSF